MPATEIPSTVTTPHGISAAGRWLWEECISGKGIKIGRNVQVLQTCTECVFSPQDTHIGARI